MAKWRSAVRRIRDGQPIAAAHTNLPVEDLESRTSYLRDLLENYLAGRALCHDDAPLTDAAFIGCQVYWSDEDNAYAPALAVYSSPGGITTPASTAWLRGTVISKSGNTGRVVFFGYVDGIDISGALDDVVAAGPWYLSAVTPGHLTSVKPALDIPAVYLRSASQFWVQPLAKNGFGGTAYYTADAFVNSLTPTAPLRAVSCDTGAAATKGGLALSLDDYIENVLSPETVGFAAGLGTTVKDVSRTTKEIGPNVAAARGTGLISIVGSGSPVTIDELVYQTGALTVGASTANAVREGVADLVALTDVGEASYNDLLYYVMPQSRASSLRGRISLPRLSAPDPATLTLRFLLIGHVNGVAPDIAFSYRIIPYSTELANLPTEDTGPELLDPGVTFQAYQALMVSTAPIVVDPGDLVFFTLSRDVDAYAGDVGIMNIRWEMLLTS
jgi:hypothetical protein